LTLVVFDLDRFKTVNDTYGHKTGDRVLRVFADSARKILRPNDLLGRHGGEEFALVLPAATIETGYVIAERIRVAFSAACRQLDEPIPVTVSAGVATIASETTFDALMEAADAALYQAKNLGRNRVERAGSSDAGADPPKVIRVA
jgi:diguanylate cyclase (GGDEF)-like protein